MSYIQFLESVSRFVKVLFLFVIIAMLMGMLINGGEDPIAILLDGMGYVEHLINMAIGYIATLL